MNLTIHDLERTTGLTRRTIHFYRRQGVLPAAHGVGPGARYGEEHLLRLRLLPVLKAAGLRLERIARTFDALAVGQLRELVDRAPDPRTECPARLLEFLGRIAAPEAALQAGNGGPDRPARDQAAPSSGESRWIRRRLAAGVEIHYLANADDDLQRRVRELEGFARRLFSTEESVSA